LFELPEDPLVPFPFSSEEQMVNIDRLQQEFQIERYGDIELEEVRFCTECEPKFKEALRKRKSMPLIKIGGTILFIALLGLVTMFVIEFA
jgi:hypothetical protein